MSATSLEREIKLKFASVDEAREAVLAAGCTPLLGRRLQDDALLDTDDEQLRRRRCVLRVRVENGKSRVTFKGPVQPSIMKLREEHETAGRRRRSAAARSSRSSACTSGSATRNTARSSPTTTSSWRSTKRRSASSSRSRAASRGSRTTAAALGRSPADYIVDSYRSLFLQHRDALGLATSDMVFDDRSSAARSRGVD